MYVCVPCTFSELRGQKMVLKLEIRRVVSYHVVWELKVGPARTVLFTTERKSALNQLAIYLASCMTLECLEGSLKISNL